MTAYLAHGIGGRQDLPIPFTDALAGAVVALVATFAILSFAWRQSRFRGAEAGRPLPGWLAAVLDSPVLRWALRAVGLLLAVIVIVAVVAGPEPADNPAPGMLYVVMWVCVPLLSLVVGPVWKVVSPVRTLYLGLARLGGRHPDEGMVEYPRWLGYWPAAVLLLAFTWLELVAPARATLPVVGAAFSFYALVTLVGAIVFGSRWLDRADPFEVYSSLAARLAPIGRRADGVLVVRSPFNGLDSLPATPGLAAVVLVLLGSTAYDSLSGAPQWIRFVQEQTAPAWVFGTLALLASVVILSVAYVFAVRAGGWIGERGLDRLPARFAHSLLPIALGYVVAHYFSLAVEQGQRTLILAADPLGTGNLLGLSVTDVNTAILVPSVIATLQVTAVVVGHIVGGIAAHDRAVRLFPPAVARWGQVPLLVLMVGYTYLGLTLLFAA